MSTSPSKLLVIQQDMQHLKVQLEQLAGGPNAIALVNTLELYIGKAVEAVILQLTPGILRPFLGGMEQKLGDEGIAAAQKATDAELAKLAVQNAPNVAAGE